ncbi:MAG: xanthine dehydrogenase family protein molybdopterin-binding subunit [Candidatus Binatia bacterium]
MAVMGTAKMVGARVKRVEDPRLVTGQGDFVSVQTMPGMVEMAVVRSPHGHARIKSVNIDRALEHPGVIKVITGADLKDRLKPLRVVLDPAIHPNYKPCDWYMLAWDKVRHVGEGVALVIAENRYVAEDAAELVEVDYEPLPAIHDMEQALTEKQNLVHDDWGDNVLCHTEFSTGDVDGAFKSAKVVVRERMRSNRHTALPLEGRACVATYNRVRNEMTLYSATQMPHMVRTKLAERFGWPESKIRVIAPDMGGGFGQKSHCFPEEALTIVAAMEVGKPVRWIEDRRESFVASYHAKEHLIEGEMAFDADGRILGARVKELSDIGAYNAFPWTSAFEALHCCQMFPGPYRFRNYAFVADSVVTNKMTSSVYRGVGAPIGTMFMERLLDLGAAELGIDPLDVRRRNLINNDEFPYTSVTGMCYEPGGYQECLEKAAAMVGYADFRREQAELRKQNVYRGIGISNYNEITGIGSAYFKANGVPMSSYESANIKVDPSGHVTVWCGTHSHGQAHETIYAQIAADELGVPFDKITVRLGDTSDSPYGWGTWGSRAAASGGGAVVTCSRKLAAKIRKMAGHYLEAAADDIELVDGEARVKGVPGRKVTLATIADRIVFSDASDRPADEEPGLEATAYFDPPPVTYPFGTHIAVVEVDRDTGAFQILRYIVVEDCGRIINPMVLDGQIHGGVAQGLGGCIYEHIVYDENGQPLTTSLMDYLVPSSCDVPFMEIGHVETPTPLIPGGFKGAGEGGAIAPFGAIANALADALAPFGARPQVLPFSPEAVFQLARGTGTARS